MIAAALLYALGALLALAFVAALDEDDPHVWRRAPWDGRLGVAFCVAGWPACVAGVTALLILAALLDLRDRVRAWWRR